MKRGLAALGIAALLVAAALLWAYHSLDLILKVALEYYGPDVLGTSVKVGDVRLSAKTGEGRLTGLEIGSPKGFSAPRAARFGEIRLAVEPSTLTADVIVIHEIAVETPIITFERGRQGSNLEAIQKHIEAYVGRSGETPANRSASEGGGGPRRFIVERLRLRGAKVTMTNPALRGQGVTFDLPDIELADVGKRQNGLRASEIARIVSAALLQRIAQKTLTNIDLLRRGGVEGAVDALKGLFK